MNLQEPAEDFQTVYFITDWWDGPKTGFADFNREIHCFERVFDYEKEDGFNLYVMRPVSAEEYTLQVESYTLFLDWFNNKDSIRPHPVSDAKHTRYQEIQQLLAEFEHEFYSEKYIGEFISFAKDSKGTGKLIYDFDYKVRWKHDPNCTLSF